MHPSPVTVARRDFALEIVRRLRAAGFQAYFAGGCVRDLLLDIDPHDFDIATDARPEQVKPLFRRICEVGLSFGVVRVIGPPAIGDVEVATFRSDGAYLDGRRPESVVFSSPREDASRRDFTINGMFYDPVLEQVIDYVGGRDDLAAKVLRAIGEPTERFREDKLRLLRAARFAARFGLAVEERTWAAVRELAEGITVVSVERIAQELHKILMHPTRAHGIKLVADAGLLDAILPKVAMLSSVEGLWNVTLRRLAALPDDASFPLAFAALLVDVGKPECCVSDASGAIHYPGHVELAANLAATIGRSLKLSNDELDRTAWLVEHQESLWSAETMRDSQLKRLLVAPGIDELFALHRAEARTSGRDDAALRFAEHYRSEEPRGPIDPTPLVTGRDLMQTGRKPGPKFSLYLYEIRSAQLDLLIHTKEEALEWLDRYHGPA